MQKQKKSIEACLSTLNPQELEHAFSKLSSGKQKIVKSIFLTDEAYAEQWSDREYDIFEEFQDDHEYVSPKGEKVRSKSEMLLTKLFCEYDIPYHYEYPFKCSNGTVFRPDFFLLNKRTRKEYYWEHLGLMDSESYRNKNFRKLELYASNGIVLGSNLILTFETTSVTYNEEYAKTLIQQFLL